MFILSNVFQLSVWTPPSPQIFSGFNSLLFKYMRCDSEFKITLYQYSGFKLFVPFCSRIPTNHCNIVALLHGLAD